MGSFFGRVPVILAPVSYRCKDLCPLVLDDLAGRLENLHDRPGRDYRVVLYSIDPRDTPADAEAARRALLAEPGPTRPAFSRSRVLSAWTFLVGQPAALDTLKNALGLSYRYDPVTRDYAHPAVLDVLTPKGRISRTISGLGSPPNTFRLALLDAGQGSIGSPIDLLLLRCYHFSPSTGGYVLIAFRVMQLASAAVLVMLVALIGGLVWIEKKTRRRRV